MAQEEVVYVDEATVISVYSLEQAIADGVLVEVFKHGWEQLTHGKPIVATAHLFDQVSLAGLLEIWNEFVEWRKNVMADATRRRSDVCYYHE